VRSNMAHPVDTTRSLAEGVASASRLLKPAEAPLSPLLCNRSLNLRLDTIELSLTQLKAASKKANGKLNDAFLAGLCLGLGTYHRRHERPAEALRFGVPVNQRPRNGGDTTEGNHWAPVRFELPLCDDPIAQMHEIQAKMAATTSEPALGWLAPISGAIRRLPRPMSTAIVTAAMRGTDVQASNVPGSPVPMFLAGTPMLAQYPFGPVTTSALNVTLLSYQDDLHIGVAMNDGAIDDPAQLVEDLRSGFHEVIG
jgi:diacylglycerol O-acyltransferase / wax synthase